MFAAEDDASCILSSIDSTGSFLELKTPVSVSRSTTADDIIVNNFQVIRDNIMLIKHSVRLSPGLLTTTRKGRVDRR